jgi:hypothetical protein
MKYELKFRKDYKDGKWEQDWSLSVEGHSVFCDSLNDVGISYCSAYGDYIVLELTAIPHRIDIENNNSIWLFGEKSCEYHPEPYKTLDNHTSKTVFQKGVTEC